MAPNPFRVDNPVIANSHPVFHAVSQNPLFLPLTNSPPSNEFAALFAHLAKAEPMTPMII
jgi:hypothetical protein